MLLSITPDADKVNESVGRPVESKSIISAVNIINLPNCAFVPIFC